MTSRHTWEWWNEVSKWICKSRKQEIKQDETTKMLDQLNALEKEIADLDSMNENQYNTMKAMDRKIEGLEKLLDNTWTELAQHNNVLRMYKISWRAIDLEKVLTEDQG